MHAVGSQIRQSIRCVRHLERASAHWDSPFSRRLLGFFRLLRAALLSLVSAWYVLLFFQSQWRLSSTKRRAHYKKSASLYRLQLHPTDKLYFVRMIDHYVLYRHFTSSIDKFVLFSTQGRPHMSLSTSTLLGNRMHSIYQLPT